MTKNDVIEWLYHVKLGFRRSSFRLRRFNILKIIMRKVINIDQYYRWQKYGSMPSGNIKHL